MKNQKNQKKLNTSEKVTLEIETEPVFTNMNTTVMMLQTEMENYQLAMALNDAFGLKLMRRDSLVIEGENFPYFTYSDDERMLTYLIINGTEGMRTNEVFAQYDKMLLIRGRDAKTAMNKIHFEMQNVMVSMPLDINIHDMLEYTHYRYVEALTIHLRKIECFSFSSKQSQTKAKVSANESQKKNYETILYEFMLKVFDELNSLAYEDGDIVNFLSDEKPITKIEVG